MNTLTEKNVPEWFRILYVWSYIEWPEETGKYPEQHKYLKFDEIPGDDYAYFDFSEFIQELKSRKHQTISLTKEEKQFLKDMIKRNYRLEPTKEFIKEILGEFAVLLD